jgi:hypothetical protein
MTTDELMARACPIIRDIGWAHYFAPEAETAAASLGIDLFTLYAIGRGGVLGDVEPVVVASAFGYFNPEVVDALWNAGKEIIAPREAARVYLDCAAEVGRRTLADIEGLDQMVAAADAVNAAADPVGLALYAGYRGELLVDDTPGRALQIVNVLREFRGSAHLIALRACGVDARTAHFIKRPGDGPMFGWPADFVPEIGDEQRAAAERAETLTDDLVRPAYAVLDDAGAAALLRGLDDMAVALGSGTV